MPRRQNQQCPTRIMTRNSGCAARGSSECECDATGLQEPSAVSFNLRRREKIDFDFLAYRKFFAVHLNVVKARSEVRGIDAAVPEEAAELATDRDA